VDIPEIIWRAVVQLASNNSSEDNILALTPHFHFRQPIWASAAPDVNRELLSSQTPVPLYLYLGRPRWKQMAKSNVSRFVVVLLCYR
jgi:hypothetical protein